MRDVPERSKPTKAVGIWLRVSTEDQARGESPEHHEKRARYYAEAKGWHVATTYDLCGVSGKSVMEHAEAKRMLADVRAGRITGLIFSKLARLARNTRELLDFSDIFRECGADLVSLQESIDTTTPAGRLFYTMIAAMAQWEREEISDRVAASVPIRAKLGKHIAGQPPFGYQWLDGKLVPHPDEAPVRKLLHELFHEHRRKKTVASILNERGYRTRNGSSWSDTTVERLVRDPTAKGQRRANYTKSLGQRKSWALKPESEWVWHPVEAIVSEELWEACVAHLDERRARGKRPAKRAVHLFAGLVRCLCGEKMYVPSNSPKYICKGCRNKIPVVDLEGIFHHELKRFFLSDADLKAFLKGADEELAHKEERLCVLEGEREKVKREMEKTYRLYLEDELSTGGFGAIYRPLEERLAQIEETLPKARAEIDLMKIYYLASDQVITDARDLYARWPELSSDDKRRIVEAITESVIVGKEDIEIELYYLPQKAPHHALSLPKNADSKAMHSHGFIAAISWTRAG